MNTQLAKLQAVAAAAQAIKDVPVWLLPDEGEMAADMGGAITANAASELWNNLMEALSNLGTSK